MNKNILIAGVLSLSVTFLAGCSRPYTMKEVDAAKANCEANRGSFQIVKGLHNQPITLYCLRDGAAYYYNKKGE